MHELLCPYTATATATEAEAEAETEADAERLWLIFARQLNMVRHAFVVKCKIEYRVQELGQKQQQNNTAKSPNGVGAGELAA